MLLIFIDIIRPFSAAKVEPEAGARPGDSGGGAQMPIRLGDGVPFCGARATQI